MVGIIKEKVSDSKMLDCHGPRRRMARNPLHYKAHLSRLITEIRQ